jgi:hypothetical protein
MADGRIAYYMRESTAQPQAVSPIMAILKKNNEKQSIRAVSRQTIVPNGRSCNDKTYLRNRGVPTLSESKHPADLYVIQGGS